MKIRSLRTKDIYRKGTKGRIDIKEQQAPVETPKEEKKTIGKRGTVIRLKTTLSCSCNSAVDVTSLDELVTLGNTLPQTRHEISEPET